MISDRLKEGKLMKEEYILNDNIKCYNELEKAINSYILYRDVFLPKEAIKSMLVGIVERRLDYFYKTK